MELSSEQVESFFTNGFLILPRFADKNLCDLIHEIALVHLKYCVAPIETELEYKDKTKDERITISNAQSEQKEKIVNIRRLRQVYDRDIVFKDWMESEKIRPILRQLLKDTPMITLAHHNSIMTKMPYTSTETSWHQDFRYWNFKNDNLVSIWLALDDENSQNGVLEFIPKSHKMNFLAEQFEEKEYFSLSHNLNQKIINSKVSVDLSKGDLVLFHCKLLHRANKNSTTKPKISFVYTVKGQSNHAIKDSRSSDFREITLS